MVFALIVLVVGCAIHAVVIWDGRAKGITFVRLYALLVVAAPGAGDDGDHGRAGVLRA